MWAILKDSIANWKFLKGEPPVTVKHDKENKNIQVTNINGYVGVFNQNTVVLINDSKAGDALAQLIKNLWNSLVLHKLL